MKILTPFALNTITKYFVDIMDHVEYKLGGETRSISFNKKETEYNVTKVYIYFDDLILGDISDIRVVDNQGNTLIDINETFYKQTDKGLYISFRYTVEEQEADIKGVS